MFSSTISMSQYDDDDDDDNGNDDDDNGSDDDAKVEISGVSWGVLAATFISISVAPLMLH